MKDINKYAVKRLKQINHEISANVIIYKDRVHLEFKNGMNFELSKDELKYQAILYLESKIHYIKSKLCNANKHSKK